LSERSKLWILAAGCLVFAQACASVLIPPGFVLTVFSDVTQCILLLCGTAALLPNIAHTRGRTQLFWGLMTVGMAFWLSYQLLWSYIEMVLRQDVPEPFVGDIVVFLHFVPMMAALALQPHVEQDEHEARLSSLDFVLLLTWWIYLYLFAVIPWQYAQQDELAYGSSLNALYLTEKLVFLAALVVVWRRSRGGWKMIYAQWFGASLLYALSSYVANWAIVRNVYYTGSLYDLPLAASMGWVSVVGVLAQDLRPQQQSAPASKRHGVWVARFGMAVILSLPVFAAVSVFDSTAPVRVRNFRLAVTLITMIAMGGIVFLRQHLLDCELIRLLHNSEDSFRDLKRLQAQLIQSEKLASLGQLLGGAAHELNNPLTAMLGYSELLAESGLSEEQQTLASKIAQQVRRTRALISSLLNFARQVPAEKIQVDLNSVLQTAAKLYQPQFSVHGVKVQLDLAPDLPPISGDPNQLLQVFLHIAGNTLQGLEEVGGGTFLVKSRRGDNTITLEFSDNGPGARDAERDADTFHSMRSPGRDSGLGLSACYGIVQDHHGRILCSNRVEGGTTIRVELPIAGSNLFLSAAPASDADLPSVTATTNLPLPN
jgi:signal transduction histidine kinase